MRPPCRLPNGPDCPRRSPECHATCAEYAEYERRRQEIRTAAAREKAAVNYHVDSTNAAIRRARIRHK